MRFTFTFVVLAAALATSSANILKRQNLPTCAENCIGSANTGGCSSSDEQCLCSSSSFVDSVESCIESSCSASDVQSALQVAEAICAQAGVTLSLTGSLASMTATGSASVSTTGSASHTTSVSSSASSSASSGSASASATSAKSGATSYAVNGLVGLAAIGAVALAF